MSSVTNLVPFRTFRGSLFHKPVLHLEGRYSDCGSTTSHKCLSEFESCTNTNNVCYSFKMSKFQNQLLPCTISLIKMAICAVPLLALYDSCDNLIRSYFLPVKSSKFRTCKESEKKNQCYKNEF